MDFSKFDSRSAAEIPSKMPILQQTTGVPIMDGKKQCFVLVKGVSSRSAQAQMRAEEQARMKAAKGRKGRKDDDDEFTRDLQKSLAESAARFVAGFENVQRKDPTTGELRDLTNSPEDVAWFFDLNMISMPHLLRGDGSNITQGEDETDSAFASRYESEMAKWLKPSFCQQVIDWARDDANFLASAAQG